MELTQQQFFYNILLYYVDNALKFLEKSVQSGLRDRTLLEDLAFEKLRNNDRFNMLLEEIDVLVNKEKLKFKENKIILSDELN